MRTDRFLAVTVLAAIPTLVAGCASNPHPGWSHYGTAVTDTHTDPVPVASLDGTERGVAIEGSITSVCQVKGCWMVLRDAEGREIFVRFRDYTFFVPTDAAGEHAVVVGDAIVRTVPVEGLRHFAEDARASPEEIAAITAPVTRVEFLADSVWINATDLSPAPTS